MSRKTAMADRHGNEGIQTYGGTLNVGGSLAVGRNARARSAHDMGGEALGAQLETLRAAIEHNAARVADAEALLADLRRLTVELGEPAPEPARVRNLLSRLRAGAGDVADVVASLSSIERVVAALL
jgi:hypothetical protein